MSTAKGKKGSKKPAQKHQNTFAFQPSKFSAIAQKIAATPSHGICQKCLDILEWRKRMNKYKPLTQPKKCVECGSKTIKEAYHVICNACADSKQKCAKCLEFKDIVSRVTDAKEAAEQERKEQDIVSKLSERMRRTYLRKKERGDEEGVQRLLEAFVNREEDEDSDFFSEDDF